MDDKKSILLRCADLLIHNRLTITFAESATAGKICSQLALIPHAGKFLKGGIVCYDAELKISILKVPAGLIEVYTPESMEVTKAITDGLAGIIDADIFIGVTGLTSPGGSESEEKPVGTIFIFARHKHKHIFSERIVFTGSVEAIINQTVERIAGRLYDYLITLKERKNVDYTASM
jgi:nicotinamide-nucleotide amidase